MIDMDKRYSPLVSIITPVLNGSQFIEQCIQSVLSQDYPYIEHIFVDGCSTDGTLEIIKKYNQSYPDKVIYISETDRGACDAWNKGWKLSKGEILGWLGGDDFYEQGSVATVVNFFKTNPDAYFVYGKCLLINEDGKKISVAGIRSPDIKRDFRKCYNPIATPSAFYRRQVIEKVGELNTSIRICDYEYWMRVAERFQIYYVDAFLSSFRIHKKSITGTNNSYVIAWKEKYKISRHFHQNISLNLVTGYIAAFLLDMFRKIPLFSFISYRVVYGLKHIILRFRERIF